MEVSMKVVTTVRQWNSKYLFPEKALILLLFIFPLFAIEVRHWSSVTFSMLVLLGIADFFSNRKKQLLDLHKYEKLYLWFLVAYFISFLISMTFYYPERFSETRFGNEVRFIVIIPLYLLMLRTEDSFKWLAYGAAVSIFISFGFCVYELYILKHAVFTGKYSQLFAGPVILIYLVVVLSYFIPLLSRKSVISWFAIIVLILLATFSIISTEARVAYIGFLFIMIMFVLMYTKGKIRALVVLVAFSLITTVVINSKSIKYRMSTAYDEIVSYINIENNNYPVSKAAATSSGVRLEMWRASYLFIKDYPLFGVGNGNYQKIMKIYVEKKLIHPEAANHGHPHNVFVNALMSKGLFGLACTCLVLFFPLFVYIKTFNKNKKSAKTGILYTSTIFIISLSIVAPFSKSNFVATCLILSLVIFQNHVRKIKQA